ncbi:MAG: MOSC N-terminal beta barrel domain-containing protein [Pseudomonadota bacterium]
MTAEIRVSALWRHPIKAVGAERCARTVLMAGETMPGDRVWAVAHAASRHDPAAPDWTHCSAFCRGAAAPALMAVDAAFDAEAGAVTLRHPERPEIVVRPDRPAEAARLVKWLAPLYPDDRPAPARVAKAPGRGMTDSPFPSISLAGGSSLTALGQKAGQTLDMRRFRINIWLEGTGPWQEFEWPGREAMLGTARIRFVERIERCRATHGNPETGRADIDMLSVLEDGWSHRNFGVYAEVIAGGEVAEDDRLLLL